MPAGRRKRAHLFFRQRHFRLDLNESQHALRVVVHHGLQLGKDALVGRALCRQPLERKERRHQSKEQCDLVLLELAGKRVHLLACRPGHVLHYGHGRLQLLVGVMQRQVDAVVHFRTLERVRLGRHVAANTGLGSRNMGCFILQSS
jgi:hypothetical protein